MSYLTDRQWNIILGVRDGKSIPQMTEENGLRSYKSIQDEIDILIRKGLIRKLKNERGKTKMLGRELTSAGRSLLQQHGYTVY